ncbi:MAG: ABC transporter permease [Candidatus Competibacter sp.]|nr:ABC transporter permease [Candidatus Competibacter sp.]MDG4604781.1 ABC transporter permease [Candidatus Contendobacter sp.]HRD49485.1 ABC transporter permease [Candidatus Contendobacter sp.]
MNAAHASLIRLRTLLGKEFLQLLRDPRMRFSMLAPPLFQLMVFGYAASFDVRHAEIAAVDQARTPATRALLAAVTATGHFTMHNFPDMAPAKVALDRGEIRAILRFAPDFERRRVVQIISDGSDSNSAQMIAGQLSQTLQQSARLSAGIDPPAQIEERAWFNENLDDRSYFVPGIIATIVLIITVILTAMTVVREREFGTLERLLVTPIARLEFLIGKLAAVAAVGLFDVALISLIAVAWFDVPFRGNVIDLLAGSLLFLMSALGIGLLISSYAETQQQAQLLAFFVIQPMVMLSGFAFPIANMPEGVQWLTWLDPLRYYLVVIRDVFLKGSGMGAHGFEYAMMALLGSGALLLSLARVK